VLAYTAWRPALLVLSAQDPLYETGPIVHRQFPLNAEPRPARLGAGFITSQADFYVRNHGTVPTLSEEGYRIHIDIAGAAPVDLSLADLKNKFPRRSITAVMQCAGNRRADMGTFKAVSGDAWRIGAISNAAWGGVGLADVLRAAGLREPGDRHVAFAAHDEIDEDGEHFQYGVSIPLAKALAPESLLAFEMNGESLTPAHGFPLRVVVPGYAGVRSPKWLASIAVQDRPSDNHIQQKTYKLFPPHVTKQTVDVSTGPFINDMPLNSAILFPSDGDSIPSGRTTVRGYAIATTQRVARVEVSPDGGTTWTPATLETHPDAPWSWTPWAATLDLAKGRHELAVRAFDTAGGDQPATPAPIWNYAGYLSRAWHRIVTQAV
jgi:sulfite oxidase